MVRRSLLTISLAIFTLCGTGTAPRQRSFHFEYAVRAVNFSPNAQKVDLWIPVPHDDPWQTVSGLKFDSAFPYAVSTDALGNRILHVRVDRPADGTLPLGMSFDAVRTEHIQALEHSEVALPERDLSRWLQPDRLVPLDATITQWAREVVTQANAKTDLEMARAIYNHIVSTVKYDKTGKGWGRGDIYYACDARRGNCTDFHAIFIGYARALGIPARFAIGFPLPADRGAGKIAGYHCWAEFYAKGIGWVPIDASEAAKNPAKREYFFGAHDENRIELSRGRDLILNPPQAGEPLNYFVYPYVEVDGKPYSDLETTYSYSDR
jgi:transglutaminase-like putative cysteine protease